MDNMSSVFGGKIPGLEAPIEAKISMPKIETNIFDRRISALDVKKGKGKKLDVLNMKLPKMEMPKFKNILSTKSKKEDVFKKMSISFNKKQRQFLPKTMKMTLNGGSFRNTTKAFETRMLSNRLLGPEKTMRKRLKTQKKLNMFGDYDKDGVTNILDCQPKNRKRQGPENNVPMVPEYPMEPYQEPIEIPSPEEEEESLEPKVVTGVDETIDESMQPSSDENAIEAEYTMAGQEGASNKIKQFVGQKFRDVGEFVKIPDEVYEEKEPEEMKEKGPGVIQRAGEVLGILPTAQQKAEREELAGIRKEARKEAVAELEKQKIKDIAGLEKQKVKEEYRKEKYKETGMKPSTPYQMARGVKSQPGVIERLQTGVRTGTTTISEGIGAALPGTSQKISDLIGLGSGRGFAMGYLTSTGRGLQMGFLPGMEPPVEMPPPVPQSIPATPMATPSAPVTQPAYRRETTVQTSEGKILSPYSKRPVRYTRGPYRKRTE